MQDTCSYGIYLMRSARGLDRVAAAIEERHTCGSDAAAKALSAVAIGYIAAYDTVAKQLHHVIRCKTHAIDMIS
jgi:hypothetical protein